MNIIEAIERLFEHYGYWVLLIGLPLDFIALPIPPGNSTLTYTGFLAHKGIMPEIQSLIAALAGALTGLLITYWIGYKLGFPFIERYGKWIFLKPEVLARIRHHYDKYGNKLMLICFFIPGIRQFIGYFIGIMRVPFRMVLLYAFTGTIIWVAGFWSIGYIFGDQWQKVLDWVEQYLMYLFGALAVLALVWLLWRLALGRKRKMWQ